MRVFLIDVHPLFREGLKKAAAVTADVKVVGEASDIRNLCPDAWSACDVMTIDDNIESLSFLRNICDRRSKGRPPFFLVFGHQPMVDHAIRFLIDGADGFVNKSESPENILRAIRTVGRGGKFMTQDVAEGLLVNVNRRRDDPESLSRREYQVLYLVASGLTVSEIADKLTISVKTVSTYRSRLLEKLNVISNAGLMRYAFRHGVVSLDLDVESAKGPMSRSLQQQPRIANRVAPILHRP